MNWLPRGGNSFHRMQARSGSWFSVAGAWSRLATLSFAGQCSSRSRVARTAWPPAAQQEEASKLVVEFLLSLRDPDAKPSGPPARKRAATGGMIFHVLNRRTRAKRSSNTMGYNRDGGYNWDESNS